MTEKRRILFVDDEPNLLNSLRRALLQVSDRWDMTFVGSGRRALEVLAREPFDVIVSDLKMPEMDGFALLSEVKERYPQLIRIAFSGQIDYVRNLRRLGPVHQYLSKPVSSDVIIRTIDRACSLHDILHDPKLRRLISQMDSLPTLPVVYQRLVEELESPRVSLKRIADIISEDQGMTVKILQFINSAFFGLPNEVLNLRTAVAMLGLDIISSLALTAHVFQQTKLDETTGFSLETLWQHSVQTSVIANMIAGYARSDKNFQDVAFTSGLLHDVGKLVLIDNMFDRYRETIALSSARKMPVFEAERELLGTTHAEVGAYLLGLWGLSESIVEAVAFHHCPDRTVEGELDAVLVVSIADYLDHANRLSDLEMMLDDYGVEGLVELVLPGKG